YDYGGSGTNPVSVENPGVSGYEVTAIAQVQIDGSVVTQISGHATWNGPVTQKGILTVSADGMTTTLLKDADNNGTYEHKEVAVTRIDGSIQKIVTDYNSSGTVTQTVTMDVSADGQSTSVITANATTGTGTTTSVGVEFMSPGTTNDTITGSAGDDQINGGAGNDTINAGAGDDFIDGGIGADTMNGGAGNDTYVVDNASDQVSEAASQGTDTVLSSVTYTISDSDVENLTLTGTASINGNGNTSANVLTGNSGDNMLDAGSGNDTIYGGAGNDFLLGNNGDDTVYGGVGADYMNGGDGSDTLVYQRGDGADRIEDFTVAATTASSDINAANALNVKAGGIVDTWVGGYYWQASTNSLLKAGATSGSDTLKLTGGITADNLSFAWGGPGLDNLLVTIAGGPAGDSINLSQYGIADSHGNAIGKIEKLQLDGLSAMNLVVARSAGAAANGGTGSNIIFGLAGNETLRGNTGADIIYGGAGNDVLSAGTGDDTLVGGTGNDYENGEGGSDRYVYRRGDGADTIEDFSLAVTTAAADISAAQALGVSATGYTNTWIGGYLWQTSSNSLL
ncbi:calcium-binding protein, partial [Mesorhizobium sp. B3-1-8]|uniref:calcium-binding protein n=1 Tax=Mesorhizobium sp. B3-1-8 TaxID=2589893 RepID=UPI00112ACFA4